MIRLSPSIKRIDEIIVLLFIIVTTLCFVYLRFPQVGQNFTFGAS